MSFVAEIKGNIYVLDLGNGSMQIQRRYVESATDSELSEGEILLLSACDEIVEQQAEIAELKKAMSIYAREKLGNMNFESDDEVIEYFLSFNEGE